MTQPLAGLTNIFIENCPSREVLRLVGDRWTLLVVAVLERGTQRNSDLLRQIGGISPKVLSATLRKLEEHGLVMRTVHPEIPPRVEYSLTALGNSLSKVLVPLDSWVEDHFEEMTRAKEAFGTRRGAKNPWQVPEVVQTLPRPGAAKALASRNTLAGKRAG